MSYSIVIPVLKLEGNPYLGPLLDSLGSQTLAPAAVHIVIGDRRQGRAINFGVSRVATPYFATLDDDSFIDDPRLFEKIIAEMEADPGIGMAGAACEIPDWASPFQKKAMREVPRRHFPRQEKTVPSDMVQHPCLAMRTDFFREIGGEDEQLIRGLDPVLRKKVRDRGKKVVIVRDTAVAHLLPDSAAALWRMYYRNGRGSGYAQRHHPERVLELSDGLDGGKFVERRGLPYRMARKSLGMARALVLGEWVRLMTDMAYACGVLMERLAPGSIERVPQVESIGSVEQHGRSFPVWHHHVNLRGL